MHTIERRTGPTRRMALLAMGGLLGLGSTVAMAGQFPEKPVKLIIGNPPGGTSDILARLVGAELSLIWKQPVVVENMAGASGSIAMGNVARSAPDGYTIGLLNLNHVVFEALTRKPPYVIAKDLTPIVAMARQSNVLVVSSKLPVSTTAQLVAYLKANPSSASFASGGPGSPSHLGGELFKQQTGVEMVHVPYRGAGPAVQDVVAGNVTLMFAAAPSALPQVQGGTMRALGVTGDVRAPQSPSIPTLKEQGFDVVIRDWQGLVGPAGLADDVVRKINADVQAVLARPEIQARISAMGGEVLTGPPADFTAMIQAESTKWKRVITTGGLTAE